MGGGGVFCLRNGAFFLYAFSTLIAFTQLTSSKETKKKIKYTNGLLFPIFALEKATQ
jgi:hypothetical protein